MRRTRASRATESVLLAIFLTGLLSVAAAACGEDEEPAKDEGVLDSCACAGGSCIEGECALRVVIDNGCGSSWGTANIFLNDLSSSAEPIGAVSEGAPFQLCEALEAPSGGEPGETFTMIVESEDTRQLFGSTSDNITFQCTGSEILTFTVTCE